MKTLSITLQKNELCYDIDFITYKVAKVHFHEILAAGSSSQPALQG